MEGRKVKTPRGSSADQRRPAHPHFPDGSFGVVERLEEYEAEFVGEHRLVDDALLLGVRAGDPLLVERRLIHDQRGRPIERTESRYAAERYGLDVGFSVEDSGVAIMGPENLPSAVPYHASQMFSKNIVNFLNNMMEDGKLNIDKDDEIVREMKLALQEVGRKLESVELADLGVARRVVANKDNTTMVDGGATADDVNGRVK